MADSRPRQNFHAESEAAINEQINLELHASYVYLSMSYNFDRDDVALPGLAKFFKERSDEERAHAEAFMKYQNKRGGRIALKHVEKPAADEWGTGLDAMEHSLQLEKKVNASLIKLEKLASNHGDSSMSDYICNTFLSEQVDDIKKLSDHITKLQRVGGGLGEFLFDKDL